MPPRRRGLHNAAEFPGVIPRVEQSRVGSPGALERKNLAGLVERVTFHNEDSGFCVLRVKARGQRDLITVIGHAATVGAGEFVQASGRWVNDRTHGVQFLADFLRAAPPTTAESEKYLASGIIRGIGPYRWRSRYWRCRRRSSRQRSTWS